MFELGFRVFFLGGGGLCFVDQIVTAKLRYLGKLTGR